MSEWLVLSTDKSLAEIFYLSLCVFQQSPNTTCEGTSVKEKRFYQLIDLYLKILTRYMRHTRRDQMQLAKTKPKPKTNPHAPQWMPLECASQ